MPNYEDYLEHFFSNAEKAIRAGKDQELSENLFHASDLIEALIDEDADFEGQFKSSYSYCNRQYGHIYDVALENGAEEDLRRTIIRSISAIANRARQDNNFEAFEKLLSSLTRCYLQSYPHPGFDEVIDDLFERFNILQFSIAQHLKEADNADQLGEATKSASLLLENYRKIWRCSVENECRESIKHLHDTLSDIRAFEPYNYHSMQQLKNASEEEYLKRKREVAELLRDKINIQRFAAYSWAYHLYVDNNISDRDFIKELFQEYAEKDFSSVNSLTKVYFKTRSEDEGPPYWDQWEMERQLRNTIGPVRSSMAANSWMREFYLAFTIYLFDENTQDSFSNSTPEELPFPTNRRGYIELDTLQNRIENFRGNYPLDFLWNTNINISKRINEISNIFDEGYSHAKRVELERNRKQPLDPSIIESWQEQISEKFDDCLLRQALKEIGILMGNFL